MARKGSRSMGAPLQQHPHVDSLRPRPSDPAPKIIELCGYLGKDTVEGYWRIYLSSDLASYLRVAATDIVEVHRDETKLEPSRIIVRATAEVEAVTALSLEDQASFLQGQYTAALSASARLALAAAAVSRRRHRRYGATQEDVLRYPATPGFPCRPEITIEHDTCFCTLFGCETLVAACQVQEP